MAKKKSTTVKNQGQELPSLKNVGMIVLAGIILLTVLTFLPSFLTQEEVPPTPELPPPVVVDPTAAQQGDHVVINYTLKTEDGKVVDTNNPELALSAGLKTYTTGPYQLIIGKSDKVAGFDEALLGMHAGDTKSAVIKPSQQPTRVLVNQTRVQQKNQPIPRITFIPLSKFVELFKKQPAINTTVSHPSLPYPLLVLNASKKSVGVSAQIKEGQTLRLQGLPWNSTVLGAYERLFTVRHNPQTGMLIDTQFGAAMITANKSYYYTITYNATVGQYVNYSINPDAKGTIRGNEINGFVVPHLFKVVDVDKDYILIQREDNLAEKKLTLEVTMLALNK